MDLSAATSNSNSPRRDHLHHTSSSAPFPFVTRPLSSTTSSTLYESDASSSRQPNTTTVDGFTFPEIYQFRPFFTLQPTPLTRSSQISKWSSLILSFCKFHRLFRVSLTPAFCNTPLFHNTELRKRLKLDDILTVLEWMNTREGGSRCEWIKKDAKKGQSEAAVKEAWIWWHYPSDWANEILAWVDGTGQKGVVFTVWEMREGESTLGQSFHQMDADLLQRALGILAKRGKAQIFGGEGEEGVKFF